MHKFAYYWNVLYFFVSDFRVCFTLETFPFVYALVVFSIKLTIHPGLLDMTFSKYRLIIFQEGHSYWKSLWVKMQKEIFPFSTVLCAHMIILIL